MQLKKEQIHEDDYIDIRPTTHLQKLYLEVESRIQDEMKNIKGTDFYTQYKLLLLRETLHTLARATVMKEHMDDYIHLAFDPSFLDIDLVGLSNTKLTTVNDLIDYKPRVWDNGFVEKLSIREVLNMARSSLSASCSSTFANDERKSYHGCHAALWGKTKSLNHFEKSLKDNPSFNAIQYQQKRHNFFQTNIVERQSLYEQNVRSYGAHEPLQKNGPG